jgi:hypothetical protein
MSDRFPVFAKAVRAAAKALLSHNQLYVVDADSDRMWELYLSSFPAGTNPVFRTKTEHDCRICSRFVKAMGKVVAVKNGVMFTIWDIVTSSGEIPYPYNLIADKMAAYVTSCKVADVFLVSADTFTGEERTTDAHDESIRWDHFAAELPPRFTPTDVGTQLAALRSAHQVFRRGVMEIKPEAVETVLSLINDNNLYRGEEHKQKVEAFQKLQTKVLALKGVARDIAFWENIKEFGAHIRNDVIGTLLCELSMGEPIEQCVGRFETKVAPANYKRPTPVYTKKMVEETMQLITELDLEPALERRHAKLGDVHITSVLWVDNSAKGKLKGGIADMLMSESKTEVVIDPKKAKKVTIEEFLALNHKQGMKLYFDNALSGNLMSLTAPVHPEVKQLFQWDNDFAWSYNGNVTDSIKEKVKRAGGKVEGVALRCSLAWYNYDDLDLHCTAPGNNRIYFGNKCGILDVDMNAGGRNSRTPVENMRWPHPKDGIYEFHVNQFRRRETIDFGFEVEVESALGVHSFRYDKAVHDNVKVCSVVVKNGQAVEVKGSDKVIAGASSQDHWGLKTLDLIKVNAVVQSPNYWGDNAVGNKHWFFILEGCKNPEPCRGIYNEYLHPRLAKHRKVFEMVGNKTKCPVVDEQLSGLGFSSTNRDVVFAVSNGITYAVSF